MTTIAIDSARIRRLPRVLSLMAAGLMLGLAPGGQARDLALLMGVGSYANPDYNLSGIDRDLDLMRTVAGRLGFAEADIRTLADAEVTSANIEAAFKDWLVPQAEATDRVLLYFSGHGSQVPDESGDEDDGNDEVLTTHELEVIATGQRPTLKGVLKDDDLHRLLKTLRSRDVVLLVDACHSGTASKGVPFATARGIALKDKSLGAAEGQPKFFYYPGMPESGGAKAVALRDDAGAADGFAMLAAAADHEKALATARGSVFTLGVWDAVESATREGAEQLTLETLKEKSSAYIDRYVKTEAPGRERHNPQLTGNPELAKRNLLARVDAQPSPSPSPAPPPQTNADQVRKLLEAGEPLALSLIGGDQLEEGDLLRLRVEIPAVKGYLNIVEVDAKDQIRVLFPNRFHPDNQVRQGALELPDPRCLFGAGCFDWPIQAPFGASRVVALFTRRPVNLFQSSDGERNAAGEVTDGFPLISFASARGATADAPLYAGEIAYRSRAYQ